MKNLTFRRIYALSLISLLIFISPVTAQVSANLVENHTNANSLKISIGNEASHSLSNSDSKTNHIQITTIGSSTVEGFKDLSFQKNIEDYFNQYHTGKTVSIESYDKAGETTTRMINRFKRSINQKSGYLLILVGTNDALAIALNKLTISATEASVRDLIETSQKNKVTPVLGTVRYFNAKNSKFFEKGNEAVEQINALYIRLAKEYNIKLTDVNAIIGHDYSLYRDAIHPNSNGCKVISSAWFTTLNQLIEPNNTTEAMSFNLHTAVVIAE